MKHLPFVLFVVFLFAGIWACSSPASQQPDKHAAKALVDTNILPLINPTEATAAKARWQELRAQMVSFLKTIKAAPMDTQFVAKGFHVPYRDLRKILDNVGDTTQLYAMLAIQYDTIRGVPQPYISLIFQAPDTTRARTVRYYDFTRPCPTECPNTDQ